MYYDFIFKQKQLLAFLPLTTLKRKNLRLQLTTTMFIYLFSGNIPTYRNKFLNKIVLHNMTIAINSCSNNAIFIIL